MKKTLFLIFALCPLMLMAQDDVINKFFDKIESQTLEADFTFLVQDNVSQPLTYFGNIQMRGEKFHLNIMGMDVAWDGNTLYTLDESNNELTLSRPTQDELIEANPFLFAHALADNCQLITNSRAEQWQVVLMPLDQSIGVKNFTMVLTKADLLPVSAEMKESATKRTTIELKNAKYTQTIPSFVISKEGAYINDLR